MRICEDLCAFIGLFDIFAIQKIWLSIVMRLCVSFYTLCLNHNFIAMKKVITLLLFIFAVNLNSLADEKQIIIFDSPNNGRNEVPIPIGFYENASKTLTIQFTSADGYFVFVTDPTGNIVLREPLKTDGSRNTIKLTILDSGLYFVFLESITNRFIGKIFID